MTAYAVKVRTWGGTEKIIDVKDRDTAELAAELHAPMHDCRFSYVAALADGEPFTEWDA